MLASLLSPIPPERDSEFVAFIVGTSATAGVVGISLMIYGFRCEPSDKVGLTFSPGYMGVETIF